MNDLTLPASAHTSGSTSANGFAAENRKDAGTFSTVQPFNPSTTEAIAAPRMLSDEQAAEANRRYTTLQAYFALQQRAIDQHEPELSIEKAARALGVNSVWLWRRLRDWNTRGQCFAALVPAFHKAGRKSTVAKLSAQLGEAAIASAIAQVSGIALDTESNTAAWRLFASSDRCPAELAAVVLDSTRTSKHSIPPSLRAATRQNEATLNAHRGPRRLALKGMWTPRAVDILPGDIFTADDTTPIWAWWVPWRTDKEHPFGVKILQGQFLPVIDVASQCAVSFVLIAREKSSYRASDIWHLFGHTFETVGLPRLGWQLERGSWESNLIAGVELEYGEGEASLSRRVGGLRQLPTTLTPWHREKLGPAFDCFPRTLQTWTSYLPKSKSVEAWFNRSQTFEGTIWGALGRDQMRKPYEKAKKLFEACKRGAADPRLHFLSQEEVVKRLVAMMDYLNHEPMEGEVFHGVPRLKFDQARAEHPLALLPEDQRWLYRRDWRPAQITAGWARLRLTHELSGERYSLFYTNPRIFAGLEGEQVVVYFDRQNFELPAQVIHGRTGEFLCEAQYEERRGSFLDGDRSGHEVRNAWRHAVTTAYATIVAHAPSRQLPPEIAERRQQNQEAVGQGTGLSRIVAAVPLPQDGSAARRGALPPPPTPDEFSRRQQRLAEEAAAARELRDMQPQD